MENSVEGYTLFNDIEDKELQANNRANLVANILEDNLNEGGKPTEHGQYVCLAYWQALTNEDQQAMHQRLALVLSERGLLGVGL